MFQCIRCAMLDTEAKTKLRHDLLRLRVMSNYPLNELLLNTLLNDIRERIKITERQDFVS